jgi:hypothetical protein
VNLVTPSSLTCEPSAFELQVMALQRETLADPLARGLAESAGGLHRFEFTSYKSAGHPIHKLAFLADIGFLFAVSQQLGKFRGPGRISDLAFTRIC